MGSFVNQTLLAELTPTQKDRYDEDRRPALYASLVALLVINNVVVGLRCFVRYHAHYKQDWDIRNIFWEDPFIVISAVFLNASIANLIAGKSSSHELPSAYLKNSEQLRPMALVFTRGELMLRIRCILRTCHISSDTSGSLRFSKALHLRASSFPCFFSISVYSSSIRNGFALHFGSRLAMLLYGL